MIYTQTIHDLSTIKHVLIYDNTTPLCVVELDFMLSDCKDLEEWIHRVEFVLAEYSVDHDIDFKKLNAKAIRLYKVPKHE